MHSDISVCFLVKQKRARGRPKKNCMEGIRKAMNERNLNEGQWEDRKQWSLGVGQRKKAFSNRYIYIYIFIPLVVCLTTGPTPLPKRTLYIVRSRASSFK
jgi:hypothetical protein